MTEKLTFEGKEYEIENMSASAKSAAKSLSFVVRRMEELSAMQSLLTRAKKSYMEGLKQEMLTKKSGFLFDDD